MRLRELNVDEYMNKVVSVQALVKSVEEKRASSGVTYAKITLKDKEKEVSAVWFPKDESLISKYAAGIVASVDLEISLYKGNPNYKISGISEIIQSPSIYMDWFDNYEKWVEVIQKSRKSLSDEVYSGIVNLLYDKYWEIFRVVPAGTGQHHVEFGGCVAHTVFLVVNSEKLANSYKVIYGADLVDMELLKASALLHDLLKSTEILADTDSGEIKYSSKSALGSHITECALAIKEAAIELGFNGDSRVDYLIHCILAHHGELEWGSPVKPALPEAMILHCVDKLDAEMWKFQRNLKELEPGQSKQEFRGGKVFSYYKK